MLTAGSVRQCDAEDFPDPVNTQAPGESPPSAMEMPDLFILPDGFHVTLFAGEPDVRQPIAFDFDDRGRIFVAENYTYNKEGNVDSDHRDRIIILEDIDGDGQHDIRKVFWDQGNMLTGLIWGFGGLWVLNDGTLSFIPDEDGDDIPDAEPVEMLNGWNRKAVHNFVNGLLWGPDGWLYGRHGITNSSMPGTPDTPEKERHPINCGIWRFHPTEHIFEVVCHGTTNPWGLDYNENGQMFMTNNVNGHLWHVIPGARYERMFGLDFNPHSYELMGPCSDHYHWDVSGKWSESRDGTADKFGGGHSHCGGMIYYGDNFPEEYRGKMFMCNTHGRCVNVDRLEPDASTYAARHEPNFLKVNTPWFRGVELRYGPAGCVYLSDWADNGECHDRDGVHRTSGRIYRIMWGDQNPSPADTVVFNSTADSHRSNRDLLETALLGENQWARRRAARIVVERVAAGKIDPAECLMLPRYRKVIEFGGEKSLSVNIAWLALAMTGVSPGCIDWQTLKCFLTSRNEHVRGIGIRLAVENPKMTDSAAKTLIRMSHQDPSAHVRLCLASAVQKMPFGSSASLGTQVVAGLTVPSSSGESRSLDPQLSRLIWYGIEPHYPDLRDYFADMSDSRLRRNYVRRWASDWDRTRSELSPELLHRSRASLAAPSDRLDDHRARTVSFLTAVLDGLRGQVRLSAPNGWKETVLNYRSMNDPDINAMVSELSVMFGDGTALADLRAIAADRKEHHLVRSRAIHALGAAKDSLAVAVLTELLGDRTVCMDVTKALANFDDPTIPVELLKNWERLRYTAAGTGVRDTAVDTMCSRKSNAIALANAVDDGRVDSSDLTATHVRQLLAFNDPFITRVIESKWGVINLSSEARIGAIGRLKEELSDEFLAEADLANGAAHFKKLCANCHRLYGEGGRIGPDLTGGNRNNLDYLLVNIVDPSEVVPKQFTTSVIALNSGRIITGVVVAETSQTLTLQTDKEQTVIAVADIDERQNTGKSLMPDGLLDSLSNDHRRNLIAFIMKRR